MKRILTYKIDEKNSGKTIEKFLKEQGYSHAVMVALKKTEYGITRNGKWAYTNEKLNNNDKIQTTILENEFDETYQELKGDERHAEISLATGALAYPYLKKLVDKLSTKYPNVKVHLYKIRNDFFGEKITVLLMNNQSQRNTLACYSPTKKQKDKRVIYEI